MYTHRKKERETERETERAHTQVGTLVSLLFIRTPVLWDEGPTLLTSFNFNCLGIGPVSRCSYTGGLGFSICILGRHSSVEL